MLRLRQSLANEQLQELERFYATAPIGLGFLDTDLRYVRVNERLAQINRRLALIPGMIAELRSKLGRPPKVWTRTGK